MKAKIIKFYADTPKGTIGDVTTSWRDKNGNKWYELCFGQNQSGQLLIKSFPKNCLKIIRIK